MDKTHALALQAALYDQFSSDWVILCETIGVEAALKVAIVFDGREIKIPSLSGFSSSIRAAQEAVRLHTEDKNPSSRHSDEVKKAFKAIKKYESVRSRLNSRENEILRKLGIN